MTQHAQPQQDFDLEAYLALTPEKASLPALTVEEEAGPLAKYFHETIPTPDPEHLAMMAEPCDPAKAIGPEQLNDLLDPGYLETETGWCNLENGAGFIANRMFYPNATAEMFDWWFAWHPMQDLRYRIWYPDYHAGTKISPQDRARLMDASIPLSERNQGCVHHVTENTGCGMENIAIHFLSPEDMGFDMSRFKRPNIASFAGGFGLSAPVIRKKDTIPAPAIMCHTFREKDGGLEHRTRFWLGYLIKDKRPELMLPPGIAIPPFVIKGLAEHCVHEFTRLGEMLPRIHAELGAGPIA
ncbi:DAPG hydrolase family protein [uncultured Cohaesibacter sp.]|uniref:DAPG hydrolase family protein n=1 Tax=uncultured Cohaesibacter sp. TaxID=1002546 RepID=UPI00292DCA13|nr:hypothetical protein [uncultured Cohaesibacter sp.]